MVPSTRHLLPPLRIPSSKHLHPPSSGFSGTGTFLLILPACGHQPLSGHRHHSDQVPLDNPGHIPSQTPLIVQAEPGAGANSPLPTSSGSKALSSPADKSDSQIDEALTNTGMLAKPNQARSNLSDEESISSSSSSDKLNKRAHLSKNTGQNSTNHSDEEPQEPQDDEPGGHKEPQDKNDAQYHECGCTTDVDTDWIRTIETRKILKVSKAIEYLEQAWQFDDVCQTHFRAIGVRLGLKPNMKDTELETTLQLVYQNRTDLWNLKTDPNLYDMWRKAHRPPRPTDSLGTLLYFHKDRPEFIPIVTQLQNYFSRVNFEEKAILVLSPTVEEWRDFPAILECAKHHKAHLVGAFKVVVSASLQQGSSRMEAGRIQGACQTYKVTSVRFAFLDGANIFPEA